MDYSFGNWVKRRRKALDLTQQELAQRVGCSLATIVKIESDLRRPSRQIAELLAQNLVIPIDQREQFLKIARQEKSLEALGAPSVILDSETVPPIKNQTLPSTQSLVGREIELAEISHLLQDPKCRLLTLAGPGGMGKTRLAVEALSQRRGMFAQGGIFINLAPLSGRDQIVTAIADALGFVLYGASDRARQLIAHLHEKELLIVLDNFEHLLVQQDCVGLPGDLLQGAPRVKLLVTSREPLQLQTEWVFEVRGLPVPETAVSTQWETNSAIRLFVERARQIRANFELAPEDRQVVQEICRLVDGMPLAIELAAGWTRTLSCSEIAREIRENIGFLITSVRDVEERHRSIRATLDYSWRLLQPEEQAILRRLSIFKGGFTREAAEAVSGAKLTHLSALISKSLVQRIDPGRFDLHELVRQYSLESLRPDEEAYLQARDRHCEYYSSLLERRGDKFKSIEQPAVAAELALEIANLRQAWQWAGERGKAIQVRQAVDALFWLYESRCDCREGVPLFGYVAKRLETGNGSTILPGDPRNLARAQVMTYQAFFCLRQGQHPQSRELLHESRSILQTLIEAGSPEAPEVLSYTLAFLGMVTAALGDYATGYRTLGESLEMKRLSRDSWGVAFCLRQLGLLAYYQGNYEEAHRLLSESLSVSRALNNSWATAYSLDFLGTVAYAQQSYSEAQRLWQEGLALGRSVGDRFTTAYALNGLGLVEQAVGRCAEARQQLEDSIRIWREIGDQASMAQSLNHLGDILVEADDPLQAHKCFQEALAVGRKADLVPVILDALLGIATLRARQGSYDSALRIAAHIKDHSAGIQSTRQRAENLYAEMRSKLPVAEGDTLINQAPGHSFIGFVDEILNAR